jgi:hypothetical protein
MSSHNLNSPVDGGPMEPVTLESGLEAWRCGTSGGHYIPADSYLRWLQDQPARLPHLPRAGEAVSSEGEAPEARLCPETGTIMGRFRVGHGFPFTIDRSITGGVWLDGGEWEALRERNFHDEIHLIFTAPWQRHIRAARSREVYEDRLQTALGCELFDRLVSLRQELGGHPHRNLALSYLMEGNGGVGA